MMDVLVLFQAEVKPAGQERRAMLVAAGSARRRDSGLEIGHLE
jgi:hypothetical protein